MGAGKTLGPIGFDYIYNGQIITNKNPSKKEPSQFLTGLSVNVKAGLIASAGINASQSGVATEKGIFTTPQVGGSLGGNLELPATWPHLFNFVTTPYPVPIGGY